MLKLTDLSKECIHIMVSYLGFQDAVQCQEICKTTREHIHDNYLWQDFIRRNFVLGMTFDHDFIIENAQLLVLKVFNQLMKGKLQHFQNLANDITDTSSIDREEETPKNTLSVSVCYTLINSKRFERLKTVHPMEYLVNCYHIQRHCGCAGPTSCYWSSHPTANENKVEYLTISLKTPVSCVLGFSVTPYQAFFHPNAPTYGPKEVSIQFLHPSSTVDARKLKKPSKKSKKLRDEPYALVNVQSETELTEGVYYQSAYFPLLNTAIAQSFFLSAPLMCVGGQVRLVLRGFSQRQVVEHVATGEEEFYMCLSHLSVIGMSLPQFALQQRRAGGQGKEAEGEYSRLTDCRSIVFTGDTGSHAESDEEEEVKQQQQPYSDVMSDFVQKHTNNNNNNINTSDGTVASINSRAPPPPPPPGTPLPLDDDSLRARVQAYTPPLRRADVRRAMFVVQVLAVVVVACGVRCIIGLFKTN